MTYDQHWLFVAAAVPARRAKESPARRAGLVRLHRTNTAVAFSGGNIETAKIVYRFRSLREPGNDDHWVEQAERPRLNQYVPFCRSMSAPREIDRRFLIRQSSVADGSTTDN
ncbi:MAG TPA: hypothetical protein VLV85_13490 [Stellaceae bacterium]|nr:hypothetical protein [Stellaceae bacterium]